MLLDTFFSPKVPKIISTHCLHSELQSKKDKETVVLGVFPLISRGYKVNKDITMREAVQ